MQKPILFLDFDRTLFNTDIFYEFLGERRFEKILDISAGKIELGNLQNMLYPDTEDFLRAVRVRYRTVLLTYTVNTRFQRKKLQSSGILNFMDDVIITQKSKAVEAQSYILRLGDPGWEHVFIDDDPRHISDMKRLLPDIRSIRIERVPLEQGMIKDPNLLLPDLVVSNLRELLNEL